MAPETTARTCAFCGDPADSGQHLFPNWLANLFDKRPGSVPIQTTVEFGGTTAERIFPRMPFTQKVRCVCTACNTGWMSRLEDNGKPILAPMMGGQVQPLDLAAQQLVATWGVQTVLVFECTEVEPEWRIVPQDDYAYLRIHQRPPPGYQVALARYGSDEFRFFYRQHYYGHDEAQRFLAASPGKPLGPKQVDSYLATLVIGQLVIQVFSALHRPNKLSYWGELAEAVLPIWPTSASVTWPPRAAFREDSIHRLADLLDVPPAGKS